MALGLRLDGTKSRVYVIIGDGEQNEGQIWEGAMAAASFKLDNLTAWSTGTVCKRPAPSPTGSKSGRGAQMGGVRLECHRD